MKPYNHVQTKIIKMTTSGTSLLNGIIIGGGAALAVMSYFFLQIVAPLEIETGVTSTEIRIAVIVGAIVSVVAIGYEFYMKKESKKESEKTSEKVQQKPKPRFVDPNKDPHHYIRRYLNEPQYKKWFDKNYPAYTIFEAVGVSESEYNEIKNE